MKRNHKVFTITYKLANYLRSKVKDSKYFIKIFYFSMVDFVVV